MRKYLYLQLAISDSINVNLNELINLCSPGRKVIILSIIDTYPHKYAKVEMFPSQNNFLTINFNDKSKKKNFVLIIK